MNPHKRLQEIYGRRTSRRWLDQLARILRPPAPLIANPKEPLDFPLGARNLYLGGAGRSVPGYLNLDLVQVPGVDIVADATILPFPDRTFQRVECDAVLEHVRRPKRLLAEVHRVLAPGGIVHIVTPFCHPFHAYPHDFQRFTIDGLKNPWL